MRTVAIIPARGGSKGIPGKNLMDFCGKPLLAWSIIQAKQTPQIDAVYVSSDSDDILSVAQAWGAIAIRRPDQISGDKEPSESAILHALQTINATVDTVVFLQATSPLRKPDDLSNGLFQFQHEKDDSLFSAAILEDFLIWQRNDHDKLQSVNYDYLNRGRRQDRKEQYVENGSFYISKPEIIQAGNRLGGQIGMYLMDFWQSFEIDAREDVELVTLLFNKQLASYNNDKE